ncbi:hypothetical protein [Nocardioides bruguierae]|uniref:hypothetical protein n=1 Tax=Nocardioides bruguierae TaxID=2945102 RepID=UPI00202222CA|nr:hypothetical protein [Nocardioides bruguierae]MCL8025042.1 hypothetical protein [Nocardioides bruguierae]
MASYQRWIKAQPSAEEATEIALVDELAEKLVAHIDMTSKVISELHVHGAQSKKIQDHFSLLLHDELGFDEEVVITPEDGLVSRARPDFFYRFDSHRGILAEVERGGAVTNNHDLKDLWKAHMSPDAHHLFLMVPNNNWREDGTSREKPFPIVARRLGAFFGDIRREVDVVSVHVFGY